MYFRIAKKTRMTRSHLDLLASVSLMMIINMVLLTPVQSFSQELETRHLFRIERSKNANIVQYDVQLTQEGEFYHEAPIIAYWIRLAKDGRRKELKWIQRRYAYGFEAKYDAKGNFVTMEMVADIGRKIKVYEIDGEYRAETLIDGHPAFIERIYIKSIPGAIFPKVEYIEFFGKDIETSECRYEKYKPK